MLEPFLLWAATKWRTRNVWRVWKSDIVFASPPPVSPQPPQVHHWGGRERWHWAQNLWTRLWSISFRLFSYVRSQQSILDSITTVEVFFFYFFFTRNRPRLLSPRWILNWIFFHLVSRQADDRPPGRCGRDDNNNNNIIIMIYLRVGRIKQPKKLIETLYFIT